MNPITHQISPSHTTLSFASTEEAGETVSVPESAML